MLRKKIHEMDDLEKLKTESIVQNMLQLLLQAYNSATERGIKALFIANGGGLVTMLTYFYGLPCSKQKLLLLPLKLFLVGFIAAIIIVAIDYLMCLKNIFTYKQKVTRFAAGKINLEEMHNVYNWKNWIMLIVLVLLGCLSAIIFIAGCWIGIQNFYPC